MHWTKRFGLSVFVGMLMCGVGFGVFAQTVYGADRGDIHKTTLWDTYQISETQTALIMQTMWFGAHVMWDTAVDFFMNLFQRSINLVYNFKGKFTSVPPNIPRTTDDDAQNDGMVAPPENNNTQSTTSVAIDLPVSGSIDDDSTNTPEMLITKTVNQLPEKTEVSQTGIHTPSNNAPVATTKTVYVQSPAISGLNISEVKDVATRVLSEYLNLYTSGLVTHEELAGVLSELDRIDRNVIATNGRISNGSSGGSSGSSGTSVDLSHISNVTLTNVTIDAGGYFTSGLLEATGITVSGTATSTFAGPILSSCFSTDGVTCISGIGGGITSLNGLAGASQTFATTSDTNIGLRITSSGSVHTFMPEWIGTLGTLRGGTGTTSPSQFLFGQGGAIVSTSTIAQNYIDPAIARTSSLANYLALSSWYATTTDALDEGSTNKYYSNTLVGNYISGSSTIPHIGGSAYGDLLYWAGSAWLTRATSTLGIAWNDLRGIPTGFADNIDNDFATTSADYWETQQIARTADDLTDNSIEDLSDVTLFSPTAQDLLYYDGSAWSHFAKGSDGQVLKMAAGMLAWGSDIGGGGGGAGHWATSSNDRLLYPEDTTQTVLIGNSATTVAGTIFEVTGTSRFIGNTTITGTASTSALVVSTTGVVPYASSTAITVSGAAFLPGTGTHIGSLNGPLQAIGGLVSATSSISESYIDPAIARTSSLANYLSLSSWYATTTDALDEGSTNKYYSNTLVGNYISGSSTIPHIGGSAYGDLLSWNGTGWTNIATSSLGIGGGQVTEGQQGQIAYYATNGTAITATSSLYISQTGMVGIGGNTNPSYTLDVAGSINVLERAGGYRLDGSTYVNGSTTLSSTLVGVNVGRALTDLSYQSTGVGFYALASTTDGTGNTAVGAYALQLNTIGGENTAVGAMALNKNIDGTNNAAFGYSALQRNTGGIENTAIGAFALNANTGGEGNTAVGNGSLQSNVGGDYNTALGGSALQLSVTGLESTAVGYSALYLNAGAISDTALGAYAGQGSGYHSSQGSTYIGYQSGYNVATGTDNNTFLGYRSGYNVVSGNGNMLLGYQAGENLTIGSRNIALGYDIDLPSATADNQLNIGNLIFGINLNGTGTVLSTGNVGIGTTTPYSKLSVAGQIVAQNYVATSTSATSSLAGSLSVTGGGIYFGADTRWYQSNQSFLTSSTTLGAGNLAFGYQSASQLDAYGAVGSTFIGFQAGQNATSSTENTAVGYRALQALITNGTSIGYYNTALGALTLRNNTSGYSNTAIGAEALFTNTTGVQNTAVGSYAMNAGVSGNSNVAIGPSALRYNKTGSQNIAIGYRALLNNLSATSSVAIGVDAAQGSGGDYYNVGGVYVGHQAGLSAATSSNYNTMLGHQSGRDVTTGSNNILIGAGAGLTGTALTTGRNNIIIGFNVGATSSDMSYGLNIGNLIFGTSVDGTGTTLSAGNIGIGTTSPYAKLSVGGQVAGEYLTAASTTLASTLPLASTTVLSVSNASFLGTVNSGTWNGTSISDAYIDDNITASNYLSLASWYSTSSAPQLAALSGLSSFGSSSATTTAAGNLFVNGTTSIAKVLIVNGTDASSTFANGINLTSGCFAINGTCVTGGSSQWTNVTGGINYSSGVVGIASSSPSMPLSVSGNTWLDSRIINFASTTASTLTVNYLTTSTSTIVNNKVFAWSLATSTLSEPILSFDTRTGFGNGYATTSLIGNFDVNSGALQYDSNANITSIERLNMGNMKFVDDAGLVSWVDLPVSTSVAANTLEGYVAQVDSQAVLTVYGIADGSAGTASRTRVIVGSTSSSTLMTSTNIPTGSMVIANGALCVDNGEATSSCAGAVRTAGYIYSVANAVYGFDVAEDYPTHQTDLEAGDVVMLDPDNPVFVKRYDASATTTPKPFGVVSTHPGVRLGGYNGELYRDETKVPIALSGRVPVKVTGEGGNIAVGDRIAVSVTTLGFGTKATSSGYTIGTALENFVAGGVEATGTVLLFVGPQQTYFADQIHVDSNSGFVGIGTTSPKAALQVDGDILPNVDNAYNLGSISYRWKDIYATNGVIQTSDARLKKDITNLDYGLKEVLALSPITFSWNDDESGIRKLGFLAQDVKNIMPELVAIGDDKNHTLGLRTGDFIPVLVKAIQEQQKEIETLKAAQFSTSTIQAEQASIMDTVLAGMRVINELVVPKVKTDVLCLGQTCISETELKELLEMRTNGTSQTASPAASHDTQETEPPAVTTTPDDQSDEPITQQQEEDTHNTSPVSSDETLQNNQSSGTVEEKITEPSEPASAIDETPPVVP